MDDVYPPDYDTAIGQVRLLIPDTAQDANSHYIFSDSQLQAFLALHKGNIKRAAANALDIISRDTVLLLKVIRTDDLQVDGVKVGAELRIQAKALRDEAEADDLLDSYDTGFQIVYPHRSLRAEATPWPGSQFVGGSVWG